MKNTDLTVVIPIYNEEENIPLLIDDIIKNYTGINILIVDDFSTDNSVSVVNNKINIYGKNIELVEKDKNRDYKGLTYSIIKGIKNIKTEYFIIMDGDFQHPVKDIQEFIRLFNLGNNFVIGERKKLIFIEKRYRVWISNLGNFFINLKIRNNGFNLKDPLSGFLGGKKDIFIEVIDKNEEKFVKSGYKFLFEFLKLTNARDYKIGIFKFDFGKRRFGLSKISFKVFISFIIGLYKN